MMVEYIYTFICGIALGFLLGFACVLLYAGVSRKKQTRKKYGFVGKDALNLSADSEILSSSREDRSAKEFK